MAREALQWDNLTVHNIPVDAQPLYDALQSAKEAFEEYFQARTPKGKVAVFSYRTRDGVFAVGIALTNGRKSNGSITWLPAAEA